MGHARTSKTVQTVLSLGAMIALWAVLAVVLADPEVLPGPARVLAVAVEETVDGPLIAHMLATLARVALAFALAMGIGTVLGYALGRMPALDRWLDPWVVVLLNLPALVVIVLCYLWIGLNEAAAIAAVTLNKAVNVLVTVREGARTLDPRLADMARVFRMSRAARLRHVVLPQLAPFISAAGRNGLAIIWKLVLVVEFLGRPDGIGFQIHLYFQLFDIAHVLAYSLSFVALMLLIEYFAVQPVEARVARWRVQGEA